MLRRCIEILQDTTSQLTSPNVDNPITSQTHHLALCLSRLACCGATFTIFKIAQWIRAIILQQSITTFPPSLLHLTFRLLSHVLMLQIVHRGATAIRNQITRVNTQRTRLTRLTHRSAVQRLGRYIRHHYSTFQRSLTQSLLVCWYSYPCFYFASSPAQH